MNRDMNAHELIYTNKLEKRVLLISSDYRVKEELDGILTQIHMPKAIQVATNQKYALSQAKQIEPHLILLDDKMTLWQETLTLLRFISTEVPIILLTDKVQPTQETKLILAGVQRFIAKDTLRFCGQILYRSIHGYSLQKYYQVESKTQQRVSSNIEGLQKIQKFWQESNEILDPVCKEVFTEISDTLEYLRSLQKKLLNIEYLS